MSPHVIIKDKFQRWMMNEKEENGLDPSAFPLHNGEWESALKEEEEEEWIKTFFFCSSGLHFCFCLFLLLHLPPLPFQIIYTLSPQVSITQSTTPCWQIFSFLYIFILSTKSQLTFLSQKLPVQAIWVHPHPISFLYTYASSHYLTHPPHSANVVCLSV